MKRRAETGRRVLDAAVLLLCALFFAVSVWAILGGIGGVP
jgi:hypothetical protein